MSAGDRPGDPRACDLLIEAGFVAPVRPHGVVLEDHAIAIADAVRRPDGCVLPGLVNAHVHNPMTLLRGVADDLPLMEWLQGHIWPLEAQLIGPDFVADGITLA